MSQLGQSRPNWLVRAISAIPLTATKLRTCRFGRFVPISAKAAPLHGKARQAEFKSTLHGPLQAGVIGVNPSHRKFPRHR